MQIFFENNKHLIEMRNNKPILAVSFSRVFGMYNLCVSISISEIITVGSSFVKTSTILNSCDINFRAVGRTKNFLKTKQDDKYSCVASAAGFCFLPCNHLE